MSLCPPPLWFQGRNRRRGLITSPEDITRAVIKGTVSGYPQNPFATSYIGKTSHVEEIIIEEGFTSLTQYLVGSEVQRVYVPRSTTTIWGAFTNAQNGLEIYYAGSEQEFNSITFGPSDRNDLNRCVIHYNSTY